MKLTRIVLASALVVALGACNGNNDQNENGAATPATTAAPASTAAMTPPPASTAMKPPASSTAMTPPAASTAAPAKSSSGG